DLVHARPWRSALGAAGALAHRAGIRSGRQRRVLPAAGDRDQGRGRAADRHGDRRHSGRGRGDRQRARARRRSGQRPSRGQGAVAAAGALAGQLSTPANAHPGPARLVAGVVFLGVVVSWAGTWLWNLASSRLSPAVAGLLVNLETVSGFGYVYAVRQHWPPAGQLAGL